MTVDHTMCEHFVNGISNISTYILPFIQFNYIHYIIHYEMHNINK